MEKLFNIEDIRSWEPCYDPSEHLKEDWKGTVDDILELEHVPIKDRFWVVLREECLPGGLLSEFACRCAENVLHLFEKEYPDKKGPRKAIEARRAYMRGEISLDELNKARDAAYDATSLYAAYAYYAASASACAATASASPYAAPYAAIAAYTNSREKEREKQLTILKELIHERGINE
jgi:hypothetical protein